ncbi:peptidoglycan binding domain-containing protein [Colletotrichum sp. SAR11_240]|nr:peptidoglycan binding domain-containing protein [Colletotrichum sp. SAR11_240]
MIATVGLLTPSGPGYFYAVFEDYESMTDVNRDLTLFMDPQALPYDSEDGKAEREWEKKRKLQYEEWLTKIGYTRHKYQDVTAEIKTRRSLSSVGVEFNPRRVEAIFNQGLRYSAGHTFSYVPQGSWVLWLSAKKFLPWAKPEICAAKISSVKRDAAECIGKDSHPAGSEEDLWKLARPCDEALLNTNERILSSVRVRLACQGLALDDAEIWDCKPLTRAADGSALWKLERGSGLTSSELDQTKNFRPRESDLGTGEFDGKLYPVGDRDGQWRWVLVDKRRGAVSLEKVLPEEPVTGYWERYPLALTAGKPDVWRWAEETPPLDAAGSKA